MVDNVKIYIAAGNGGNGCSSFKGVKFTRSYRSDGGNGGLGANVIIKVDSNLRSLKKLRFNQHFRAENGKCGQANRKKGADARPCVIKVPCGTIVRDLKGDLLLRDLIQPDTELIVAKGGKAGRGNTKSRLATVGLPGEQKRLFLELKLVCDIALIGYPNSGKSTFLAQICSARPKIASYPFTTTFPFLASLQFDDFTEPETLAMVEIPGLTKGSSQGRGLGLDFLRHAERARVFIHLIDLAQHENRSPLTDYDNLNQELKNYSDQIAKKQQVLVANKIDLPGAEDSLAKFCAQTGKKVYPISALTGTGIEELLDHLRSFFKRKA